MEVGGFGNRFEVVVINSSTYSSDLLTDLRMKTLSDTSS